MRRQRWPDGRKFGIALAAASALVLAGCTVGEGGDSADGTDDAPPDGAGGGGAADAFLTPAADGAALPDPRTEVAGAAWRGGVVVAGGLRRDGSASPRVDRYDPGRDAWSPLPDLPVALHHTGLAVHDGRLYAVGGFRDGPGGWSPDSRVWTLAPDAGAWVEAPALRTARGALAVASTDGGLLAVGGVGPGGDLLASTERFDGGSWVRGPDLPQGREHLAAVGLPSGGALVVAGRQGGIDTNLASTLRVRGDRVEDTGDLGRSRGGIGAAVVAGIPCAAGGEEPTGTIAPVECLLSDGWTATANLATPRHGLAVVSLPIADDSPRLHVIGGGPEPGLTVSGEHEIFEVAASS